MSVKYRYWLLESREAQEIYNKIVHKNQEQFEELKKIASEVGASNQFLKSHSGKIIGLKFDQHPDRKLWKKVKGYHSIFCPKRNNKNAKILSNKLNAIRLIHSTQIGKSFLGHGMLFINGYLCKPGIEKIGNNIIISARDDRESNEPHKWKPISGLKELKPSEYFLIKGQ